MGDAALNTETSKLLPKVHEGRQQLMVMPLLIWEEFLMTQRLSASTDCLRRCRSDFDFTPFTLLERFLGTVGFAKAPLLVRLSIWEINAVNALP